MAVQQQPLDNYYFLQNKEEIETSIPKEVEKAAKEVKKTDKINLAQTCCALFNKQAKHL